MTTPIQPEVAKLVASLTKAQREVILRAGGVRGGARRAIDFSGATANGLRIERLTRPALVGRYLTRDHGRATAWYFLTALGLRVRQSLMEQANKGA